ncbi:MAG: hypothetical protein AAFV95_26680 [Bacteroidota bacterium]
MKRFYHYYLISLALCGLHSLAFAQTDASSLAANVDFKVRHEACDVWINFEASTEKEKLRYGLEWSTDGEKFETLRAVKSYGKNVTQVFSYRHRKPADRNYYRLKMQVEKEAATYTKVVEAAPSCQDERGDLYLFPNPVKPAEGMLYIRLFRNGEGVKLKLRDASSDLIRHFSLPTDMGWNVLRLDLSDLPPGIYFLNDVEQVNGRIYKFKIQ